MHTTVTLDVQHPRSAGRYECSYQVSAGEPLVIGRGLEAHFRPTVQDKKISRKHCALTIDGAQLVIENFSPNGSRLNGVVVEGRAPVQDGDVLRVGQLDIAVRVAASREVTPHGLVGQRIQGYLVEEQIASGALGDLYRGIQQTFGRRVAIRVLPRADLGESDLARRFLQVARLAGVLAHPNIVQLYDCGESSELDVYYLVMEYVAGLTLEERLKAEGPIAEHESIEIAQQIASALAFGHKRGIIHRDVNPHHVIVGESGVAKLVGLGLAKSLGGDVTRLTRTGAAVGDLQYCAPEQILDASRVDARTDVYALGAVLYRCLSGRAAYEGKGRAEQFQKLLRNQAPPLVRAVAPEVSESIEAVVAKAMAFSPEQRFASMEEMLGALARRPHTVRISHYADDKARRHYLAMLPECPIVPGCQFATVLAPVDGVGGDFYDFFPLGAGEMGVVLGDVSGHGVGAAVVVGMIKTSCKIFGSRDNSPAQALAHVNEEVRPCLEHDTFATVCLGVLDFGDRSFRFARGGHNPVIVHNPAREPSLTVYNPPGTVIGLLPSRVFQQEECVIPLEAGDLVLLYTDGVVEAMNGAGEFYDEERLHGLVSARNPVLPPNALVEGILAAVRAWTGDGPQQDDITLVAMQLDL